MFKRVRTTARAMERRRPALLLALLWVASTPTPAAHGEAADEIERAEALALARYHEGFPPEYGAEITEAGAARLAELLADPARAAHHATLIEALAASGAPGAYEALAGYAQRDLGESIDARQLRALRTLPVAMGRLARSDDRALEWLLEAAGDSGPAPFASRVHSAEALGARLHRQALLGLGLSGRPEAAARLRAISAGGEAAAARAARQALDLETGGER